MSELEPQQVGDAAQVEGTGAESEAASPAGAPAAEAAARQVAESPVRAALTELDALAEKPVAEHPGVYQRVHSQLQNALSDIDDA
jgi:hypothetical protein